jgi:hypothetical protein
LRGELEEGLELGGRGRAVAVLVEDLCDLGTHRDHDRVELRTAEHARDGDGDYGNGGDGGDGDVMVMLVVMI